MLDTSYKITRHAVGRFSSEDSAARALHLLAAHGFDVARLRVLAGGVSVVDDRGELPRLAEEGASRARIGAFAGAVVALVFGLSQWVDVGAPTAALVAFGLVIGAAAGALMGLFAQLSAGQRRERSKRSLVARSYVLLAESGDDAENARLVLSVDARLNEATASR